MLYRRNISTTVKAAQRVLSGEDEAAFQAFALPVAVVAPAGDIVWANEAFAGSLCDGKRFLGDNVLKYIYPKTFRQVMSEHGAAVSHGGREYTVYGARSKAGYILYFVDDTTFKAISKEFRERRPVVCLASFDNREELVRDSLGGDDSRVTGEVDAVLRRWVIQEMNGFIYRLDSSRYLFVVDDAHIEQAKQKRFRVLDEVRAIRSARNNMSATVSIGAVSYTHLISHPTRREGGFSGHTRLSFTGPKEDVIENHLSKEEHFVTENGKEKKTTRTRRSPAGEKNRQQDQVLSGATDAPKIGKIAGPKKTAAKKTTERTAQRGRGKAESKKTETKKSETKKPEAKKTAEKAASTGKKKTETSRKAPARGSRKPQKPAISQTAAQLEAIRAQQEACLLYTSSRDL